MTLGISLAVITVAVVALVIFLIMTLLKVNKVLEKTSSLVDHLNENLPPILSDLRNTGSNLNTISEVMSQGVQSAAATAAAGADYLKSFKFLGTIVDIVAMIRKALGFIRKTTKGA